MDSKSKGSLYMISGVLLCFTFLGAPIGLILIWRGKVHAERAGLMDTCALCEEKRALCKCECPRCGVESFERELCTGCENDAEFTSRGPASSGATGRN